MSFGNAFLNGLNSGRREQSRRMQENRLEEEAARTAQTFARRQRGLNAIEQRFGQEANAPVELGQLEGIDQRRQMFPTTLAQAQENLAASQDENARNSAVIGFDYLDKIAQQAAANNEDPVSAVMAAAGGMTPQARRLLGIEGENLETALSQLNQNPGAFGQVRDSLRPPKSTGSTAAPRFSTGAVQVVGPDGQPQVVRGEVVKNPDGTVTLVGQPDAQVLAFQPDAPFAPKDFGTSEIFTFGAAGDDPTRTQNISGIVQEREIAERSGNQMGDFIGKRWAADQTLSQTESNEGLQLLEGELARGENTLMTIDEAIDQIDWQSAGTLQGLKLVDGSTPANVAATLQTVQSNAIIDQLVAIKRTGATLGQITEKELEVLQNSVAALSQSQTPEQLRRNLRKYRSQLGRTLDRARANVKRDIERGRLNPSDDLVQGLFPELAQTSQGGNDDALDAWLNQ